MRKIYLIFSLSVPVLLSGQLNLIEHIVDDNIHGTASVYACDLDSDGDLDILGASMEEHTIAWWRNNGGDPIYWTYQLIGTGFAGACIAQGVDLDGDTDIDVVGTAQAGGEVAWWRNEGGSPFQWTKFMVDSLPRAWPLYCCDLDQDSDIDIIAGSSWAGTNEVKWWENQGTAITETAQEIQSQSIGSKIIHGDIILPLGRNCQLFNASGRAVAPDKLPSGVYYLVIDNAVQTRIVKLK